jgi:hypothetical protein
MDKKETESPKLTQKFLIWISAFMLLLFLLLVARPFRMESFLRTTIRRLVSE